jgi:hypothetical protein
MRIVSRVSEDLLISFLSLRISARIFVSRLASRSKEIAFVVVWERAEEDLQRMLGSLEGIDEAVEAGAKF